VLALICACSLTAADPPYIAIIEKVAGAVAFYSEQGLPVGRAKVGPFPHEAALDGDLLYVSDNGVLWMTEDKPGNNAVSVVDVKSMKTVGNMNLGRFHRPHGIALIPGTHDLLATTERPFGLIRISPDARPPGVSRDFDVKGKSPHMVIPTPDGLYAWVSDTDSDQIVRIRLSDGDVKAVKTGARPQGAVLAPSGDRLFVTNTNSNTISVVDTRTLTVAANIPTGKGPARIALTPDGRTLVYNLQFEPAAGFADVASRRQTTVVPLSGRPLSLTMTRDGSRVFAGIQDQDKVVFISTSTRRTERVLQLPKGSGPDPAIPLR
jgi:YVTN family beta-propeller protein